jgi:hypothetical protein
MSAVQRTGRVLPMHPVEAKAEAIEIMAYILALDRMDTIKDQVKNDMLGMTFGLSEQPIRRYNPPEPKLLNEYRRSRVKYKRKFHQVWDEL